MNSPQQIIEKLLYQREMFVPQRFMAQADNGGLSSARLLKRLNYWQPRLHQLPP